MNTTTQDNASIQLHAEIVSMLPGNNFKLRVYSGYESEWIGGIFDSKYNIICSHKAASQFAVLTGLKEKLVEWLAKK